jgi:UDP-N-acetylglucosamine pyrophosphorylase
MEVTRRTPADRKGGHLARDAASGELLLRESAQCPPEDQDAFQDIDRHSYFNTNNLWIRLDALRDALDANRGALPLPVIRNVKTLDPRDPSSPSVYQLETAMGAAISCFPGAAAVCVDRDRFAPVKTTDDLLVVRSDACTLTKQHTIVLHSTRQGAPPSIRLDPAHFKTVDQFDTAFAAGIPSLLHCSSLEVKGPVRFAANIAFSGDVRIVHTGSEPAMLPSGGYSRQDIELPAS